VGDFETSAFTRTINFFSYFTILTIILAAMALTLPVFARESSWAFFSKPTVRTAITACIIIVFLTLGFVQVTGGRSLDKQFRS
jgi:VIT1/CCC1 family predicted Fe2+/Mn2+ transporter